MGLIVFLTDRAPAEALPALNSLGLDFKTEPLASDSVPHLLKLAPSLVIADAHGAPSSAYRALKTLAADGMGAPVAVILEGSSLELFPWHQVADEVIHSDMPGAELWVRLQMLDRRTGGAGEGVLRLGALSVNTDTYQVLVKGRPLNLTYKEFELLRFLVQRPGRVFTRSALLRQVWGYEFYGGGRTVDVHVRRLRAKLGPEHEGLVQTVRGVGYRAAHPPQTANDGR